MKNHQFPKVHAMKHEKPLLLQMAAIVISSAVLTIAVVFIANAVDTKFKHVDNPSTVGSVLSDNSKSVGNN